MHAAGHAQRADEFSHHGAIEGGAAQLAPVQVHAKLQPQAFDK